MCRGRRGGGSGFFIVVQSGEGGAKPHRARQTQRGSAPRRRLQQNATSWDNGCQKPLLLTPFLTPVAPGRARDRVPSILALGLFLPVSDFTQPENGLPTPPLPFPYTGCHQTASYSPKMAPLHFCTSGSEMPLTEEPGLYKRPCPRSPSHSVSTTNTLSGALCLRPLPSASRTSSLSHLLAVLPFLRRLLQSPAAVSPANHGP